MNRIRAHIVYPPRVVPDDIEGSFSPDELLMLIAHYPHGDTDILARAMNRTTRSIIARANKMGLHKTRRARAARTVDATLIKEAV